MQSATVAAKFTNTRWPIPVACPSQTVARIMVGGSVEKMFDKILGKEMMIAERHRRFVVVQPWEADSFVFFWGRRRRRRGGGCRGL